METKVLSAKTKIWASFHVPRKLHRKINNQGSMRNKLKRINIQGVNLFKEQI
jgi:hypothetical protein